jgi:hypothetical protein
MGQKNGRFYSDLSRKSGIVFLFLYDCSASWCWQSDANAPILPLYRQLPMFVSPTSRKGMKMTPSIPFALHASCSRVRTHMQIAKRWQGICRNKRM